MLKGTYKQVEVIFFFACGFYVTYIVSAIFAKPDWLLAAKSTVIPSIQFSSDYLLMLTGLIGTTIAPWQFFYLQAGFVEKKVSARQYPQARADVLVGSISCMAIVFFIIVCTAATLYASGQPTSLKPKTPHAPSSPSPAHGPVISSPSVSSTPPFSPPPFFRSPLPM